MARERDDDMKATRTEIENAAARLEQMLDRIPPAKTGSDWREFDKAMRARNALLIEIADDLRQEYGARIRLDALTSRMSMLGVSTTCTAGGEGLFRNWISAARRVAEALIEEVGE